MRWDTTGAVRLATAVAAGLLAAACYTTPGPYAQGTYASPAGSSYYEPDYAEPTYSVGIITGVPDVPLYSGVTWYYGVHPHPDGYHEGRFCHRGGAHNHDYDPYQRHRYEFHDGYYYWLGDPEPFGLRTGLHAYFGHHPHPHYFGSYCYIGGRHHHNYSPHRSHRYDFRSGVFHFTGVFGNDYHEHRKHYDHSGWRHDRHDRGYDDHHRWKKYREQRKRDHRDRDRHRDRVDRRDDRDHRDVRDRDDRHRRQQVEQRERDERRHRQQAEKQGNEHRQLADRRSPDSGGAAKQRQGAANSAPRDDRRHRKVDDSRQPKVQRHPNQPRVGPSPSREQPHKSASPRSGDQRSDNEQQSRDRRGKNDRKKKRAGEDEKGEETDVDGRDGRQRQMGRPDR